MRFRNSIRLLMENFKNVFRLLWYKLFITLIATAITAAFVVPELKEIFESAAMKGLIENCIAFVKALFNANGVDLEAAKSAILHEGGSLDQVKELFSSISTELTWICLACVGVYLLKRFFDTLGHFAVGSTLNDKMSTYAETKFGAAYVANLGKASAYAWIYVLTTSIFDIVSISAVVVILSYMHILLALFLGMTAAVLIQALKLTVTSHWLPAMTVDNLPLRKSFKLPYKREHKQWAKVYSMYLVSVYFVVILNALAALLTFGSALLITLPASYFLFICEQYVNYYTMKGEKYFLTYNRIAENVDHGDSEHFFDYVDETAPVAEQIDIDLQKK